MPAPKMVRQTSFTLGQVDSVNWRRTDLKGYLSATQLMQNMEASITAVVRKRRGFNFLAEISAFAIPEMQSFEFKDQFDNYYAIFAIANQMLIYETVNWTLYATVVTPYNANDLVNLDYAQDNDDLIFSNPLYPLYRLFVSSYTPTTVFSFAQLNIYPLPAYDYGDINYNNFTAVFTAGTPAYLEFTGLKSDPGYNNNWVGGQIIGIGGSASQPAGYGIITAVDAWTSESQEVTFTLDVILAFGSPAGTKGSNFVVRQPVFTALTGYPNCVCVYQNRLWCGGIATLPQTVFGSKINSFVSFDQGIGGDADAIVFKIGIAGSGNIVNVNAGKQLEIYTENNECVCPQDQGIGLTPSTLSIRQQTSYGSDGNLKPLTYLNDSFYASKQGKSIMQFHFDGIGLSYSSKNVSQLSSNLINIPIDRALQRSRDTSQDNYIYFLNSDYTITSFQFDTGETLAALSPIVLAQNVNAINLVTINNTIVAVVNFPDTNAWQVWGLSDGTFMDGTFGAVVGEDNVITGLNDWNGFTLTIMDQPQQQDFGNLLVANGQIVAPKNFNVGDNVNLGMIYPVQLNTMYVFAGRNLMDAWKCVTKIYVDYNHSLDFQVNGATVPYQNYSDLQNQAPLVPQSGQFVTGNCNGFQQNEIITITQNSPFDLQLQSISYQIASRLI